MFHLIFPFTQSTSNWCQLLAASAFYTLRSLRRTGACPMRLGRFVFAYDRVGAFGSAFVAASFGSGSRSAHAPRCWIVGSNCRHADWPRRGRLADCFGFSQRSRECEKERVWERSGREERGRVRATKYAAGLATGRRVFIHLFLLLFDSISVFSFFLLVFLIGAHSLW